MIYFDVTKAGSAGHRSGLMRVSARLRESLGDVDEAVWDAHDHKHFFGSDGRPLGKNPNDWFLTSELFSEEERPGISQWLSSHACRTAAIFHDAIPLKHPHITWPQSVARHPGYMKLLARFDHVWAVSAASRDELMGFWRWQGVEKTPPVEVLALGADFAAAPRVTTRIPTADRRLLCVGILEPRKNQSFALDVFEDLWREGTQFELHLVGRVNPHFGAPLVARIKSLRKKAPGLHFHEAASDAAVAQLYAMARASVFPSIAEGCGLPLLESLWLGVPCVCSDLPVLRENADGGGCLPVALNDHVAWRDALRSMLTDDTLHAKLTREATTRILPTWGEAAQTIRRALG